MECGAAGRAIVAATDRCVLARHRPPPAPGRRRLQAGAQRSDSPLLRDRSAGEDGARPGLAPLDRRGSLHAYDAAGGFDSASVRVWNEFGCFRLNRLTCWR